MIVTAGCAHTVLYSCYNTLTAEPLHLRQIEKSSILLAAFLMLRILHQLFVFVYCGVVVIAAALLLLFLLLLFLLLLFLLLQGVHASNLSIAVAGFGTTGVEKSRPVLQQQW